MKMRSTWVTAGLVLVAVAAGGAAGAEEEDHDLARDLYERREIHPLSDILRIAAMRAPGQVVAVDLKHEADCWVYVIQVVDDAGRRTTLRIDAKEAVLLHGEGEGR